MKIQRIASVLISALLVLGLTSCNSTKSPKKVTEEAIEALLEQNDEAFYNALSTKDKEAITFDNFQKLLVISNDLTQATFLIPEIREVYKAKDFKETISGESATVTFVLVVPDMEEIGKEAISLSDILNLVKGGKLNTLNDIPEELKTKITDYVKKEGVPTTEKIQQFKLVREDDKEWRIDLGIGTLLKNNDVISPFIL